MYKRIEGPGLYGLLASGEAVKLPDDYTAPDEVICRRVADYPHGVAPAAAATTRCTRCQRRIAFNPAGPHQDKPKVCLQCAGIEPLPIERPS